MKYTERFDSNAFLSKTYLVFLVCKCAIWQPWTCQLLSEQVSKHSITIPSPFQTPSITIGSRVTRSVRKNAQNVAQAIFANK
jgi:hypothetical protein